MKKQELKTSVEEQAILRRLTDEELSQCAKVVAMTEAHALHAVVKLLVEQSKNIFFMQRPGDPVTLALKHAGEQGRILGIESFLRILLNAKHELERRTKIKKP